MYCLIWFAFFGGWHQYYLRPKDDVLIAHIATLKIDGHWLGDDWASPHSKFSHSTIVTSDTPLEKWQVADGFGHVRESDWNNQGGSFYRFKHVCNRNVSKNNIYLINKFMAVVNTYDYVAPNFNDVTTHKANLFPQSVGVTLICSLLTIMTMPIPIWTHVCFDDQELDAFFGEI